MEDYIPEKHIVLKHILDTSVQSMPRWHHLIDMASEIVIMDRSIDVTDYIYHQLYSDIIFACKLEKHEEVRLVMTSSLGADLYLTGMKYDRFIKVFEQCSIALVESMRRISRVFELTKHIKSDIEPEYDEQTIAVRRARFDGIDASIESNDLMTLYYLYMINPTFKIVDKIKALVLHKRMHAIESLKSYDSVIRKINREISKSNDVYLQPILDSDLIEGYSVSNSRFVLSNHEHTIVKSQNDASKLYDFESFEEAMYPVTVNSVVKTLTDRWIDYDQYCIRLGGSLEGVGKRTYQIDSRDKLIETKWEQVTQRFCPKIFQVNILRYLEPRNNKIKLIFVHNRFKAWALTESEIFNVISSQIFADIKMPRIDLMHKLISTAKLVNYNLEPIRILAAKLLEHIEHSAPFPDQEISKFLILDCPASKILKNITKCDEHFDVLIVKPVYRHFQKLISAMIMYTHLSKNNAVQFLKTI